MSMLKKKSEFAGVGALIQLAGIGVFIIFCASGLIGGAIGFIAMLIMFGIGSQKSHKYYCGNCNNPVANKQVKVCPVCKVFF